MTSESVTARTAHDEVPPVPRTPILRRRWSPERSPDAPCQAARVPSPCDRAGPRW
jgi:hypothetical protein